ncbi:MAG: glycoside hydrolase family 3 N-terminal domain-containing protein, partial [Anaerobutyricum hallii]
MSYTTFDVATENAAWKPDAEPKTITVTVKVTNTGSCAGKEVVQIYAACPFGKLKKERKRLVAFGKTALLQPGESETLHLKVPTVLLESYRTGKAVYCMEAGDYDFLVGTSSRDVTLAARLTLDKTVETEHLTNICPLLDALKEIQPEEEKEERWRAEREQMWEEKEAEIPLLFLDEKGLIHDGKSAEEMYKILKFGKTNAAEAKECDANGCEFEAETTGAKEDAGNCKCGAEQQKWEERRRKAMEKAAELAQKLTPEEKTALVCGRSSGSKEIIGAAAVTVPGAAGETTASLLEKYGVANVILADGPAGIRITSHYQKNPSDGSVYKMNMYQRLENRIFGTEFLHTDGEDYYQYCSAIPVGTLLAQTFDTELLEEVGRMIGAELEEFGVTLWLAPGMNIHRNPLCGRNFEYYSEDPLVSGKMAAALTRGVQSRYGVGTTIKHYACNNQEENRRGVSSIVSERALREIYLKGFEIAIKESQPKAIMTSYNKVNGV